MTRNQRKKLRLTQRWMRKDKKMTKIMSIKDYKRFREYEPSKD